MLSFIFALLDLFEKYVNEGMNIKNVIKKLPVLLHRIFKVFPNRVWEVSTRTQIFEMMCHLYFSRNNIFNYKYVHIIKRNVLHLKKIIFSIISYYYRWVTIISYYYYRWVTIISYYYYRWVTIIRYYYYRWVTIISYYYYR